MLLSVQLLVHSFEMYHLILAYQIDQSEVVIFGELKFLLAVQVDHLLNHEIEEECDVSLKQEVVVIFHERITLLLFFLVVVHNQLTLQYLQGLLHSSPNLTHYRNQCPSG